MADLNRSAKQSALVPINIRFANIKMHGVRTIAHLCDDDWNLPSQLATLEKWLKEKREELPDDQIVADVGFQIRPDASGGGSAMSCAFMAALVEAKIELWLSEYPPGDFLIFEDKGPNQQPQQQRP